MTQVKTSSWRIGCAVVLLFVAALGTQQAAAQAAGSKEYQVKAALLLNFAQYIQWPAGSFPQPQTPIIVGVLGEDPFGTALEQTFADETVQGRKLVVRRSRRLEEMKGCHIVFISGSEKEQIADIVSALSDAGLMTVSEIDQFTERGGVINFYIDNGRLRFEINVAAAERKGLKISTQLLKRAKVSGSDPQRRAQ